MIKCPKCQIFFNSKEEKCPYCGRLHTKEGKETNGEQRRQERKKQEKSK